jgi:hypothetical protein
MSMLMCRWSIGMIGLAHETRSGFIPKLRDAVDEQPRLRDAVDEQSVGTEFDEMLGPANQRVLILSDVGTRIERVLPKESCAIKDEWGGACRSEDCIRVGRKAGSNWFDGPESGCVEVDALIHRAGKWRLKPCSGRSLDHLAWPQCEGYVGKTPDPQTVAAFEELRIGRTRGQEGDLRLRKACPFIVARSDIKRKGGDGERLRFAQPTHVNHKLSDVASAGNFGRS